MYVVQTLVPNVMVGCSQTPEITTLSEGKTEQSNENTFRIYIFFPSPSSLSLVLPLIAAPNLKAKLCWRWQWSRVLHSWGIRMKRWQLDPTLSEQLAQGLGKLGMFSLCFQVFACWSKRYKTQQLYKQPAPPVRCFSKLWDADGTLHRSSSPF